MSSSFRWPLGRLGRASIVVGLAIAGLVLVGVAVAGPSTPDATLARCAERVRHADDVSQLA